MEFVAQLILYLRLFLHHRILPSLSWFRLQFETEIKWNGFQSTYVVVRFGAQSRTASAVANRNNVSC